jgi:hypothetical protein
MCAVIDIADADWSECLTRIARTDDGSPLQEKKSWPVHALTRLSDCTQVSSDSLTRTAAHGPAHPQGRVARQSEWQKIDLETDRYFFFCNGEPCEQLVQANCYWSAAELHSRQTAAETPRHTFPSLQSGPYRV